MNEKLSELLETLPPLIACIVWDVANGHITLHTIELADKVTEDEWQQYEVVRCIAAGNPEYPPVQEAQVLIEMMLEDFVLTVA
jgi:hypothetical protein